MNLSSSDTNIDNFNNEKNNDGIIIATADDAILAKFSTTLYGYYDDPFLSYLTQNARGLTSSSLLPSSSSSPPPSLSQSSSSIHYRNNINNIRSTEPFSNNRARADGSINTLSRPHYYRHSQHLPQHQNHQQHPIIRKGTHARVCVMDKTIATFLSQTYLDGNTKQVVVLGAGKDTSYLRYQAGILHNATKQKIANNIIRWYEIDYPSVIETKKTLLKQLPSSLSSLILQESGCPNNKHENETNQTSTTKSSADAKSNISKSKNIMCTNQASLYLVPFDLKSPPNHLFQLLTESYCFDLNVPTLFVLECVQMYLPETSSQELLSTISQQCKISILSIYDPLASSQTPFGKTMQQNLLSSNVITTQSSMIKNTTLDQQIQKPIDCDFHIAIGCNMMDAYKTIVSDEQRRKANYCEMLDELEEWYLIMKHYCFVVAGCYRKDDPADAEFVESFCIVGPTSKLGFSETKCTIIRKH